MGLALFAPARCTAAGGAVVAEGAKAKTFFQTGTDFVVSPAMAAGNGIPYLNLSIRAGVLKMAVRTVSTARLGLGRAKRTDLARTHPAVGPANHRILAGETGHRVGAADVLLHELPKSLLFGGCQLVAIRNADAVGAANFAFKMVRNQHVLFSFLEVARR